MSWDEMIRVASRADLRVRYVCSCWEGMGGVGRRWDEMGWEKMRGNGRG